MRKCALSLLLFVLLAGCGKQSPPQKPMTPVGPVYCTTSVAYNYQTMTSHPQGMRVEFQFDWGGAVGDWGDWAASGETVSVNHVFDTAGTYPVAVRARDSAGLLSDWSDPLTVTAVNVPSGPARNLSIVAATDSTVRLTWSPPVEGVPSGYRVTFRPVGGTYAVAFETSDTTGVHDPQGMTGEYRVLAQFGGRNIEPEDTLSTIPVHSGTTTVGELGGQDNPGCGWRGPDWLAVTYEMLDTTWVDRVDFYVTDFKPGSDGPTYYLASPSLAPGDSGGGVPVANWRVTSFVELTDEQDPVPPVGDSSWRSTARVPGPVSAACHTVPGYFAVVKVTQLRIAQKDLRLQAWLQPVNGLRLLRH